MTRTQFMALAATLPAAAQAQSTGRVFEMRTYHTLPGRLPNLLARFRDHTTKLFEKHGMTNIGYWVPVEGQEGAGNTLIYILAHESEAAAKKSFDAFRADPAWVKARTESEKDGKIVDKVVSVMMRGTDFSKLK
ncbi:MAG: NIPSNAP family protein [Bryobacteraceae bacterium]|nr:NIPSNAP family protein [Bryobacteraceae bacterium]